VQTAYGSGLRTGANNDSHVPGWVPVDLTLAHAYRLDNGFNGSHWAPGRSIYVRGSINF